MERRDFTSHSLGEKRAEHEVVLTRYQYHFHIFVGEPLKPLGKGHACKAAAQDDNSGFAGGLTRFPLLPLYGVTIHVVCLFPL